APVPNQSIVGFNVGGWFMERPQQAGAALGELIEDIMAERIRAPAIRSLTLAQAQEAHELLESRSSSGKLVIKPWLE
ncbi:MAG: zinc-binding dehydrogenase, partial [Myxococcota bacterium]